MADHNHDDVVEYTNINALCYYKCKQRWQKPSVSLKEDRQLCGWYAFSSDLYTSQHFKDNIDPGNSNGKNQNICAQCIPTIPNDLQGHLEWRSNNGQASSTFNSTANEGLVWFCFKHFFRTINSYENTISFQWFLCC
jgi:hypothetical protein